MSTATLSAGLPLASAATVKVKPQLRGYVTIENRTDGAVHVLGKKWTLDFDLAKEIAGREGGVVAARNWVAKKIMADPVTRFKMVQEGGGK